MTDQSDAYHKISITPVAEPKGCPFHETFTPFDPNYLQNPYEQLERLSADTPIFYARRLGYLVVTGMDFHQHRSTGPCHRLEIFCMGAIGRAHFDQLATSTLHDIGHAEGAADLDQFTPRNQHLPAQGQAVEHEHYGCRVVIDDESTLGTG